MQMTKKHIGITIAAVLALLAAGIVAYTLQTPKQKDPSSEKKKSKKRNTRTYKGANAATDKKSTAVSSARSQKEKPLLTEDIDFDDIAKLTEAQLALLRELQKGIDANSLKQVAKAAEKIQKLLREKGDEAVPVVMRQAAVEALSYFLPDAIVELIGFSADSDQDVLDDVLEQFEDAIDGTELGDRDLSKILTSVSKQVTHEEMLDSIFSGIETDMRNSVAVATYKEILKSGTDAAKQRVWESVEDFTGEEITTVEQLDEWLKQNPDDEDDDDLYGPAPLDDDDDD